MEFTLEGPMPAPLHGQGCPEGNDMEEILMGGQPHEALLNSFDQIDWSNVIESAKEMAPEDEDKDDQTWDPEKETQCKKDEEAHACPFCMKRAMKKGVKMVVMKVKAMCEKTECPKMARICQFMTDNREAAFGMLVAKVEPWKFAKGFCMKQKVKRARERARAGATGTISRR